MKSKLNREIKVNLQKQTLKIFMFLHLTLLILCIAAFSMH